jgi:hypothetical protein
MARSAAAVVMAGRKQLEMVLFGVLNGNWCCNNILPMVANPAKL